MLRGQEVLVPASHQSFDMLLRCVTYPNWLKEDELLRSYKHKGILTPLNLKIESLI